MKSPSAERTEAAYPPSWRARRVSIVPHTHWDREWYSPFQTFRLRLVDLLDEFLPRLENDLSYAHFLLDGQMAVVDDYLEVRPEAEERAAPPRSAAAAWRWAPGTSSWTSSSSRARRIIRNLQLGLERAAEFGGAMEVGYLPDMFGHIAQMPQLLQLAGFEHAVVWRGMPSSVDRNAFWWTAPDGIDGAGRVPAPRLRQRRGDSRRRQGAAPRASPAHETETGRCRCVAPTGPIPCSS